MTGIIPAHVIENGGPNVDELLGFFDAVAALTDEQAARLDQAFDRLDEDRWRQAADAGVEIARTVDPTVRTAWYRPVPISSMRVQPSKSKMLDAKTGVDRGPSPGLAGRRQRLRRIRRPRRTNGWVGRRSRP